MTANEDLPQLICNECALHLNVAYNFKRKVLNAEKLFLDAMAENEDRKRPPQQLPVATNGTNVDDAALESHLEVEQKIIPDEPEMDAPMQTEDDDEPQSKYVQANLLSLFDTNELIELSDTDSDWTVEDVEVIQQRSKPAQLHIAAQRAANVEMECPACPAIFHDSILFNEHVNQHTQKRCKKCGRECYYTSSLQLHFRTHANEIPINCPQCSFSAQSQVALETHMRELHANPAQDTSNIAYQCKTCERALMSLSKLRGHLAVEHEIHAVSDTHAITYANEVDRNELCRCKTCGRQLSSYRCLVVHMRLHERDKLNFCYVCEASFRHDQNMYLHFRSHHPGQKPYKCTGGHCNATFDTLKQYDAHMRLAKSSLEESQQRPSLPVIVQPMAYSSKSSLECYVCDEKFATNAEQIVHLKTHNRLVCKKCKQLYMKWKTITEHYEHYHPNGEWCGMFVCQTCGRKFATTRSLSNHERTHKGNYTH